MNQFVNKSDMGSNIMNIRIKLYKKRYTKLKSI